MDSTARAERLARIGFPEVVTLCGSTRFRSQFEAEQRRLTLDNRIVLSVGVFGHEEDLPQLSPVKYLLDELHLRKIDLSDRVHVINVDGYIGASTRSEIAYAMALDIPVTYLVEPAVVYVAVEAFTSVEPSLTELPVSAGEDEDWYGWGHLDAAQFVAAVRACEEHWSGGTSDDEEWEDMAEQVEYRWALCRADNPESWRWVEAGTPDASPITYLQIV